MILLRPTCLFNSSAMLTVGLLMSIAQPVCATSVTATESMNINRLGHTATLPTTGQVLVAGGIVDVNANPYPLAETIKTAVISLCLVIAPTGSSSAQEAARVIEIHAKRFSFTPSEITIKKGETVKLVLTSEDVTHGLVIPDLHVNAKITKGHLTEVMITPNTTGDFHGKCGHFCGSGHSSMTFMVHVKED